MTDLQTRDRRAGAPQAGTACWSCAARASAGLPCGGCGALQPIDRAAGHFEVMGLEPKLVVDPDELERRFHELSRLNHPDRNRLRQARERLIALENTSRLNQAYRTLRDPVARAAHVVELDAGEEATPAGPPAELFEEILAIQEMIDEAPAESAPDRVPWLAELARHRERLAAEREEQARRLSEELFPRWDALAAAPSERRAVTLEMARLLGQRSYLARVVERMDEALPGEAVSQ